MHITGGLSLGGRQGLVLDDDIITNPLTELPVYAGIWADDPAWSAPSVAYTDATSGLVLPGTAGNYASTPDEAALDITGDITLVARVALRDWTPAANTTLMGKWLATGNQRSYALIVTTAGFLRVDASSDGLTNGAVEQSQSSVATPFTDGATGWVAAALDVDDGGGNRSCTFWTSTDGVTWAQLGVTALDPAAGIYSSSAPVEFGAYNGGATSPADGNVSVARIYSGSGFSTAGPSGTLVLDADFRRPSCSSFAASTGQTVTINSGASIPSWRIGGTLGGTLGQATSSKQPTLRGALALLGDRRAGDFDGTDDFLELTSGVALDQPFEVWAISALDSVAAASTLVGVNSGSNARRIGTDATPNWLANAGSSVVGGTPAANTAYATRTVVNGASGSMSANGTTVLSGDVGAQALDQIILGAGRTAPSTYANYLDGKIALLLILPAASITQRHRTLAGQWAASFYANSAFLGAFG